MSNEFGKELMKLRKASGLSHKQLSAKMSFFSFSHVAKIEDGRANLRVRMAAEKILDFFELTGKERKRIIDKARIDFDDLKKKRTQYHDWETGESLHVVDGKIECAICGKAKIVDDFGIRGSVRNRTCISCCIASNSKKNHTRRPKRVCEICGEKAVMKFKKQWLCDPHLNFDHVSPWGVDEHTRQTSNLGRAIEHG